jgi:hypothetical protein
VIGTSWASAAEAISNRLMIVRMIERASHVNMHNFVGRTPISANLIAIASERPT